MNKKEFLKELEKRLEVLDEKERKDIIDEYKDTLEEKIKHGDDEYKAVKDFGDIDKLVSEILSAYKINPEYNKSKTKKFVQSGEELVKDIAGKLGSVTEDVIEDVKDKNGEIKIEAIFEIVIKFFILLFALALLRIPFMFLGFIGADLFGFIFSPFDMIFIFLFKLLINLIYIIVCVFVIIYSFKKYFKDIQITKKKEEKVKKETSGDKTPKKKVENDFNLVLFIIKVFITIFLLIPLFFISLGLLIGLIFVIILLFKGVNLFGIALVLLGLLLLTGNVSDLLIRITNPNKKLHLYSFIVSIIILVFGFFLTIDNIMSFNYYNYLPNKDIREVERTYDEYLVKKTRIDSDVPYEVVIDNRLNDKAVRVVISYYPDILDIEYDDLEIDVKNSKISQVKNLYDLVIDDLKDNNIYNYKKYFDVKVKVYVNERTRKLIN